MKKQIKRMAVVLTVVMAIIGIGGTVAFASGYIQWGGSDDYYATLDNLEQIGQRGQELINERDESNRENEQLRNTILDRENQIDSLEQDIIALQERIDGGQTTQGQLEQAIKDMQDVNQKSTDILNGLQ